MFDGVSGGMFDGVPDGRLNGVPDGMFDGVSDGVSDRMFDLVPGGMFDGVSDGMVDAVPGGTFDGVTDGRFRGGAEALAAARARPAPHAGPRLPPIAARCAYVAMAPHSYGLPSRGLGFPPSPPAVSYGPSS